MPHGERQIVLANVLNTGAHVKVIYKGALYLCVILRRGGGILFRKHLVYHVRVKLRCGCALKRGDLLHRNSVNCAHALKHRVHLLEGFVSTPRVESVYCRVLHLCVDGALSGGRLESLRLAHRVRQ